MSEPQTALPTVTYLGPEGTFTHQAASMIWSGRAVLQPMPTVGEAIGAVLDSRDGCAVIPIENTVEGVVTASLDQLVFRSAGLVIKREASVRITFNAYRSSSSSGPAEIVASHPHGLGQCTRYLAGLRLPVEHFASTAAAVEAAAARPELIAIGAAGLQERYAVSVVREEVEDHPGAYTRFVCVGRHGVGVAPPAASDPTTWKTSLALTPSSTRPGVLAELCGHFADHNLNILSLTSRPLPGFVGAYVFVVSVSDRGDSRAIARSVHSMVYSGIRVKFLGNYQSDHLAKGAGRDRMLMAPVGSYGAKDFAELVALFPGAQAAEAIAEPE